MNRFGKGIISIYKTANHVVTYPHWSKETQHRAHATIFKYEAVTIYRDSYTNKVHLTKLPLALF